MPKIATLQRGLVGWWQLDNIYGAKDRTPYENNGTGAGGITIGGAADRHGQANKATTFDGTDDTISMGNVLNFAYNQPFSVTAWIYAVSPFAADLNAIMSKQDDAAPYPGWRMGLINGKISFRLYKDSPNNYFGIDAVNALSLSTWYHITCTYNGSGLSSGMVCYVNGVAVSVTNTDVGTTDTIATSDPLRISGRGDTTTYPYKGLISDARIYNRALSATEITALYESYNPNIKIYSPTATAGSKIKLNAYDDNNSGLAAGWHMNEGTGTTIDDSSVNKNTGTFGAGDAAPTWVNSQGAKCLSFDGSNDFVNAGAGYANFQDNTPFSVSVWIKTSGALQVIVSKWKVFAFAGWRLDIMNGVLRFFLLGANGSQGRFTQTTANTYADGTWKHVVGTYDGSQSNTGLKIYVNSIAVSISGVENSSPGTLGDTPIYIGATDTSTVPTLFFNGLLDEARIYNYALTQGEITNLYNKGKLTHGG